MNVQWACEQLQDWLDRWDEYEVRARAGRDQLPQLVGGFDAQLEIVTGIVREVNRDLTTTSLMRYDHYGHLVDVGANRVRRVLGYLQRQDEVTENMGPQAPKMSADRLHPVIWTTIEKLWGNGHYREAVQRAATQLNAHLQSVLDRYDVSDTDLVTQAFSPDPPKGTAKRLRWPGNPEDQTVKSMNAGLIRFGPGVFLTVRNTSTHTAEAIEEQVALEQLATLSLLARWIDACDVHADSD